MVSAKQQKIDSEGVFTELSATQTKLEAVQHELVNQQRLLGESFNENKQLRVQISELTREKLELESEKTAMVTISKSGLLVPDLSPEKKEDSNSTNPLNTNTSTQLELVTQLSAANVKVCFVILVV